MNAQNSVWRIVDSKVDASHYDERIRQDVLPLGQALSTCHHITTDGIMLTDLQMDDMTQKAHEHGFDAIGFTPAVLPEAIGLDFDRFVELGCHGTMAWFTDRLEHRRQPTALWSKARGAIVLASSYAPDSDPLEGLDRKTTGNVSVYARGRDYHDVIKKRLKAFARWLSETYPGELKVFVDTAPVAEKPLAQLAGIGWQGKHTNLVSRQLGNWFFLSVVLIDRPVPDGLAEKNHCGRCQACLSACPTEAFMAPYKLDARRCISYLTIEHKGSIPEQFRAAIGNRIYGCDDCLAACPWNKFAQEPQMLELINRPDVQGKPLQDLLAMDDASFRQYFSKSPIKRIGLHRFKRNILTAMGNSGDCSMIPVLDGMRTHEDEVLADAANFAIIQLRKHAQHRQ